MPIKEQLPPNYDKLDTALRAIGYSFESAVADIIDNSIDAGAEHILVRLIEKKDGTLDLAVIDNGRGMSDKELHEAMRFGADLNRELKRLGKFGLGLKLASLSQAKDLIVVSKKDGELSARAWLEDGIENGFELTIYNSAEAHKCLAEMSVPHKLDGNGTVVYWGNLHKLRHYHTETDSFVEKLAKKLGETLKIAFHRYIAGRISITVDVVQQGAKQHGIPYTIPGLNPFGYTKSGHSGYPKKFFLAGELASEISITAHIWPPNSEMPEYKLPGGSNSRQGFYFYRNDRVIQAGGWNTMREAEPHMSLARVEVDLDPKCDLQLSLDVKKSEIHLTPELLESIKKSKAKDGTLFTEYLDAADTTYRTRGVLDSELPLVPAEGVPSEMREIFLKTFKLPQTAKHRKINFEWQPLDEDIVFEVNQESDTIILNKEYREHLLHGMRGSSTDVPSIKCLIFIIAMDAFRSERMGSRIRQKLELANLMLRQAVKYERRAG